ncbi:hypothetical protein BSKO_03372 [Bryopsis sp. KO-2023]|nr:hypothetical protein BSKO_03372 [Bryopsis sp. KO-2023]
MLERKYTEEVQILENLVDELQSDAESEKRAKEESISAVAQILANTSKTDDRRKSLQTLAIGMQTKSGEAANDRLLREVVERQKHTIRLENEVDILKRKLGAAQQARDDIKRYFDQANLENQKLRSLGTQLTNSAVDLKPAPEASKIDVPRPTSEDCAVKNKGSETSFGHTVVPSLKRVEGVCDDGASMYANECPKEWHGLESRFHIQFLVKKMRLQHAELKEVRKCGMKSKFSALTLFAVMILNNYWSSSLWRSVMFAKSSTSLSERITNLWPKILERVNPQLLLRVEQFKLSNGGDIDQEEKYAAIERLLSVVGLQPSITSKLLFLPELLECMCDTGR